MKKARPDFIVFDVETTGLSWRGGDRVIEIAGLKVRDFKPVERFHSLVNPRRPISHGAFAINGITQEMVEAAPPAEDILPGLMDFIGDNILVAHNAKFDLGFLANELALAGGERDNLPAALDTVKMARGLMPGLPGYSLAAVAYTLGMDDDQTHRAMDDVMITYKVFCRLAQMAADKGMDDWASLLMLFGYQRRETAADNGYMTLLEEAIRLEQDVTMTYFSPHYSSRTVRKVRPLRLLREPGRTVLVGYCYLRRAEREFRVDRILKLRREENGS